MHRRSAIAARRDPRDLTAKRPTRASTNFGLLLYLVATSFIIALLVVTLLEHEGASVPAADLRNGRAFIQDNLWSTATEQYAVWVAPDGTPFAGKRRRGADAWEIVDLSLIPGNPLAAPTDDNEHNVFAIAVDSLGYVHIAGNMRRDPLRYIRSSRPFDLTSWERGEIAGPADVVTYPQFASLPDGTLLFWRWERDRVVNLPVVLLDALPPGQRGWHHLGTILDGRATNERPYLHHVAVDSESGTIHIMFVWRGTGDLTTNNDLGYARSEDGGRTWRTSGGRALALPITHSAAEEAVDTAPTGSGLVNNGGLAVDADGRPHGAVVFYDPSRGGRSIAHVWHDGSGWRRHDLDGSLLEGRPSVAAVRSGQVWLIGVRAGWLTAIEIRAGTVGRRRTLGPVPPAWEATYDSPAVALHDDVEFLVPDGYEPQVVTADLG